MPYMLCLIADYSPHIFKIVILEYLEKPKFLKIYGNIFIKYEMLIHIQHNNFIILKKLS